MGSLCTDFGLKNSDKVKLMVFKQNSTNQWVMWLLPSVIYSLIFTVHHSKFTLLLSDSSGYRILEILNHSTPSLKGSALKDDIMDVSL